ncbi:MAG: hypothetical protein GX989_05430 [Firmicutes bacterium]|nr:hypothetical protein [Bacillota bacterium]
MRIKTIKGYPVVNLTDGTLLGRVQDLIINPLAKKVEGLVIGEKGFLKGRLSRIPFEQIYNIGKDVLIVKEKEQETAPETHASLEEFKDYSFLGSSVVSSQGDYIAKVQDFTFSVQTGAIKELLLYDIPKQDKKDKDVFLSIDGVLNLGKDYVIATLDYSAYIREEHPKISRAEQTREVEQTGEAGPQEYFEQEEPLKEEFRGGESRRERSPSLHLIFQNIKGIWDQLEKEIASEGKELARESKDKIKRYVLNKKANYPVRNNEGQPLIEPGMEITEETLQQVEAQNKIYNLFLAVISQELEDGLAVFKERIRSSLR